MKAATIDPATEIFCGRIETDSGLILRFAFFPHDLTMSNGEVYIGTPFYSPSDLEGASDLSPSVFDTKGFFDSAGITRDQILSGVLDNAKGYAFTTSWANPVEDEQEQKKSIIGKSRMEDEVFTIENMSLSDATNQTIGTTVNSKCTHTLFDETLGGQIIATDRSRCTGPRSAQDGPLLADYEVTGTVTSVTSQKIWTDSGRTEDAGYFDYGSILWTGGDNAGFEFEVKTHATGGVITQHMATHYTIQVGDTYKMIPGCDHDLEGDCITKYNNAKNTNAKPYLITEETYGDYGLD